MNPEKESVSIKLTPMQQAEIREITGKDAETLTFQAEELEERIVPGVRLQN